MSTLLITGFPGFLGSALLPRLLAKREGARAICLVQSRHMATAGRRLEEIAAEYPQSKGKIDLVAGDITKPGLVSDAEHSDALADVDEVWHLAAVYDLAVPEEIARKVNVDGTANVIQFCKERENLKRLQYVSTCYVSGRFGGEFQEGDLDVGQSFNNHYEATKFEAEQLVAQAMAQGLPATIYRPGIVVGDSRTGETQKYDGPYFVADYMSRTPVVTFLPDVEPTVRVSLVPRDFVIGAMDELSVLDKSLGKTYALTDPNPPTAREVAEIFGGLAGKKVAWLPVPVKVLRSLLDTVPGMEQLTGLPAETLDYMAFTTTYSTTNTVADLEGTGLECPQFSSYAATLYEFMQAHPEFGSAAMV